jgi:hypothetical protein
MSTVVFIPFDESDSQFVQPTTYGEEIVLVKPEYFGGKEDEGVVLTLGQGGYTGWKGITKDDVVCLNSAGLEAKLNSLRSAGDTLYIRGHCAVGSEYLQSDNQRTQIKYDAVVAHLMDELPKSFAGKIKIFACNSASSKLFSSSFVQRFADMMYVAGFKSCTFWGYTAELNTIAKNNHKMVKGKDQRASTVKTEVTPGLLTKLFS